MTAVSRIPLAMYRLQFSREFTFRDAEQLTGYLHDLGISHLYASPYLKAREGSPHGYDVTDYNALNPEIGTEEDLGALTRALRTHDMGQILDFVPNHMGVGKADNPWWLDVLEWGRASPYAGYFDIDWTPAKHELRGKVLLPFLGDHYGRVLEGGELTLCFDATEGSFGVWYHEHLFPICPAHYARILMPEVVQARAEGRSGPEDPDPIERLAESFRSLRRANKTLKRQAALRERGIALKRDLAALAQNAQAHERIVSAAARFSGTPGEPASFLALHRLLERQAYRLAYWRVAADEINYRRFFDINELAGIKIERSDLFETVHALLLRWISEGKLDGVRLDHIDGLFDPAQYFRRLTGQIAERLASSSSSERPAMRGADSEHKAYVVVEKILAQQETLPTAWPLHGTTGYDALNLINGLFVRPDSKLALNRIYARFAGPRPDFDEVLYHAKQHILDQALSSELQVLANELDRISESNWRTRDFTLVRLKSVLKEIAACFPVYRTYVDEAGASAQDREHINTAINRARRRSPDRESTIIDFIHQVLTTDLIRGRRSGYNRQDVIRFAKKFQQLTGPVTAKALEDTSFYRFNRLISLNEVGGDPRRFGVDVSEFHDLNQDRAQHWPYTMITTATHDTKRGEDARARINTLSEFPALWGDAVRRWVMLNRWAKQDYEGERRPTRNDEYFLYQTLIGSFPNELLYAPGLEPAFLKAYRERVEACMVKAVREGKHNSNWTHPDTGYEDVLCEFVRRVLDPVRSAVFLGELVEFMQPIAWYGMLNGLSQTLLKLTIPGIPDVYQGAELWDYNMVDPDNRRPVDFGSRIGMLEALGSERAIQPEEEVTRLSDLIATWPDGRIKLFLIHRLLQLRKAHAGVFLDGRYVPLLVTGERSNNICAFARIRGDASLIVVASRFFGSLSDTGTLPVGEVWGDTSIACMPEFGTRGWACALTGREHASFTESRIFARDVLVQFPFTALLAI